MKCIMMYNDESYAKWEQGEHIIGIEYGRMAQGICIECYGSITFAVADFKQAFKTWNNIFDDMIATGSIPRIKSYVNQ
jgi:hypothetical protein